MKTIVILTASLFCFAACRKSDSKPGLPAATTTGAETFGCYIDGEAFIVNGLRQGGIGAPDRGLQLLLDNGKMALQATSDKYYLAITIQYHGTLGNYPLDSPADRKAGVINLSDRSSANSPYVTTYVRTGSVNLTHYDGSTMSGTFAFDAERSDGKTIHVTEGRFDIK